MTISEAAARKFSSLLRRLKSKHEAPAAPTVTPEPPDAMDPAVHQLVFSVLLWEASTSQARNAQKRLRESLVDYNELRVCMADELAAILGEKYPLGHERCLRLRSALNDLFRRQQGLTLLSLKDAPKREARAMLESLEGIPPFAAARVFLLDLGGHGLPCDERLRDLLAGEGVIDPAATPEAAASWLEHHIRAEDAVETHLLLQTWSDEEGHPPKREKRPAAEARQPAAAKPAPKARAKSPKGEAVGARHANKSKSRSGD
ncbi:hypothetical protein PHYC_00052 [Phycisphaerales bacterium]|nr:hypothetical protein PHYC_00052 [Phycisphaerales bacterium]